MKKLKPLNDEILIREQMTDEKTKAGIIIPKTIDKGNVCFGEVLAISEGILLQDGTVRPHSVVPGDIVLFDKRGVFEVELDGETLLLMRSLSLLAKVVEVK